jgi:hypothetical protein
MVLRCSHTELRRLSQVALAASYENHLSCRQLFSAAVFPGRENASSEAPMFCE